MQHCNSIFSAQDIWYLLDNDNEIKRKLYISTCPICNKNITLYSCFNLSENKFIDKYFYSNGALKIREKMKKDVSATMLGFKNKYKAPSGFKYGKNVEIKKDGKIIGIKQYSCDFFGNKVLVKKIMDGNE